MELGFIGLGRMGLNMVKRLRTDGHRVIVWNRSPEKTEEAVKAGAVRAHDVSDLVLRLSAPRVVWMMVPAGDATQNIFGQLLALLSPDDVIVDGGNSFYRDSIRRYEEARMKSVRFIDCGTSGGVWGLANGYCIMAGGDPDAFSLVEPALKTLAPPNGCLFCGPAGAGHFVKMVHNGIEYGMLQAYAEGFEILKSSRYPLDLKAVSHLWNQGSVVRSWLLELCEDVFKKDPDLTSIGNSVADSGEGRWTIQEALDLDVPAPVIALSLFTRFRSRQTDSFGNRVIAALRNEFGGHAVEKKE